MAEKVDIVCTASQKQTTLAQQGEETEKAEDTAQKETRTTPPVCTKFERARIIAYWAQQIALGAKPLTDPGNCTDALQIAEQDLDSGRLGQEIIVRRYLPDGSQEDWLVEELKQVQT